MASPNISFTQIPGNIRKPGVYIEENTSNALHGLTPLNDSICLIAQRTSAGSVAKNIPTKVFSDADAQLYFGAGSVAHLVAQKMFYTNPNIDLTICAVDDNGTTKATGSVALTDTTASAAGSISVWIGDQGVQVPYAQGDSNASITAAIATALSSIQNNLPVTDTTSASTVTFTARNAGTIGNRIPISAKVTGGLVAPTITAMASGAAESDMSAYTTAGGTLAAVVGGGYTMFVNAVSDSSSSGNWTYLKNTVDFVSGPLEQRPAILVGAMTDKNDTLANVETFCGTTLNHGRTTICYTSYASDNLAKTEYFKLAGSYAAELAYNSDPAVPYDGLPLVGVSSPAVPDRLTRTQQESLLLTGATPIAVLTDDQMAIVRAISTYTTTSGVPDPTLLDITTIRTLDYVRAQVRTRLVTRFPRSKLSSRTANLVRSQVLDVLYLLQGLEIVQNVDTYKSGVIVETDSQDPTRLDIKIPTNIVSGLHVLAGVLDLIL